MASKSGIQKAKLLMSQLPPLSTFPDGSIGHYVRYRIISEDRNKTSHWSPVYAVRVKPFELLGEVSISYTSSIIAAVWGDEANRPKYDVFVRWGNAIDRASSVGTTRTLRTTIAHGYSVGDRVRITNTSANYNGTYTISAITSNTFSYVHAIPQTESDLVVTGRSSLDDYYYHGTTSVYNYSFMRTGNVVISGIARDLSKFNVIHVDVQVESIEKLYSQDLLIYDSPDDTGYLLT